MFPTLDLHALLEGISSRVGRANSVTIERAAELRIFAGLTPRELSDFAARHHLRVVSRLGGSQLEFTPLAPFP